MSKDEDTAKDLLTIITVILVCMAAAVAVTLLAPHVREVLPGKPQPAAHHSATK